MSFDYDRITTKNEHGSWWTSYADLFMMLSIVFLLMYVASSLRSGSAGFQQQVEYRKLARKAADLEEQIKVYNTLKDESLKKEASEEEQQVYQKLMDRLALLQDEANKEKIALRRKAKENEEKEFALNQYQQLVRNIINTNILAKSQIIHRDKVIIAKDVTIEEKKKKIGEMEQLVSQNNQRIAQINAQLDAQIAALRDEQFKHKMSTAEMERRIDILRTESQRKVSALEEKNRGITSELTEVKGTLAVTEEKLDDTEQKLGEANITIDQQIRDKTALAKQLESDRARYSTELAGLRENHAEQLARERSAFEANLNKQRMSNAARAKKLADYAAAEQRKAKQLESELTGLRGKIANTESQLQGTMAALSGAKEELAGAQKALAGTQQALAGAKRDLAGSQEQLAGVKGHLADAEAQKQRALAEVEDLKDDLAKTRAIANARKQLAAQITDQFAKAGMKGAVDGKTGEVTLDFGEEYFDTGSTTLKPQMEQTLDKFIPLYAKSLFTDPKVADKIANIEIVGFASSTYKGRYVNPKSLKPQDKDAIEYNLKLSFGRANSIFKHVLNQKHLTKDDRDRLLPLMKVVGRGYLPEGKHASDFQEGMSEKQFCSQYNCKKAQKVVVKFNMKD